MAAWDATGAGVVAATTALGALAVRHVTWWQPKESSDYQGALRRYSKDTKVKGCNVAAQAVTGVGTTVVTFTMLTYGSAVTLVGASTLAAGVALGAAALAF